MSGSFPNNLAFPHRNAERIDLATYGPQWAQKPSLTTSQVGVPGHLSGQGNPEAPWHMFFGHNSAYNAKNPYDAYPREIDNLPEAYKGQNLYLSTILITRIPESQQWMIREALPFKRYEGSLTLQFDMLKFDDSMLGRTPEQAPSRLLTHTYDSKSEVMTRYGIGLMLEHGFMRTPRGRESYFAQLLQIVNATVETLCFAATFAILNVDYGRVRDKTLASFDRRADFERAIDRDLTFTFIIQKSEGGWYVLRTDMEKEFQERNNMSANYLIVGPGVMDHINKRQEENYYYIKGPAVGGGKSAEQRAKQGFTVHEFRGFHVGGKQPNQNPALRIMVCSKFARLDMSRLGWCDPADWKTRYMDREIHNERTDQYYELKYKKLLPLTGLFDPGSPQVEGHRDYKQRSSRHFGGIFDDRADKVISPPRYVLSPLGMEFYNGYTSWGQYMADKDIERLWIKSFLGKSREVQNAFFDDICHFRRPAMPKGFEGAIDDENGWLPGDDGLLNRFGKQVAAQQQQQQKPPAQRQQQQQQQQTDTLDGFMQDLLDLRLPGSDVAWGILTLALDKGLNKQIDRISLREAREKFTERTTGGVMVLNEPARGAFLAQEVIKAIMIANKPIASSPETKQDDPEIDIPIYGFGEDDQGRSYVISVPVPASLAKGQAFAQPNSFDGWFKAYSQLVYYPLRTDVWTPSAIAAASISENPTPLTHPVQQAYNDIGLQGVLKTAGLTKTRRQNMDQVQVQLRQGQATRLRQLAEQARIPASLRGRYSSAEKKRTGGATADPIPVELQRSLKDLYARDFGEVLNSIYAKHVLGRNPNMNADQFKQYMEAVQKAYLEYNADDEDADGREFRMSQRNREKAVDLLLAEFYFGRMTGDLPAVIQARITRYGKSYDIVAGAKATMRQLIVLDRTMNETLLDAFAKLRKGVYKEFVESKQDSEGLESKTGFTMSYESTLPMNEQTGALRSGARPSAQDMKDDGYHDVLYEDVRGLLHGLDIQNADIVFFSAENDIYPPLVHLYIMAPSVTYQTSPTVLMAAYGAAGYTFHGWHSMELADHAIRKVHVGHFTLYLKAMIMNEDMLVHRYHTFCHQYLAGADCTFWDPLSSQDMQEFHAGNLVKDRMVWPVHPDENIRERRITLTGYEHPSIASPNAQPMISSFPLMARYYQIQQPENPLVSNPFREAPAQIPCLSFEEHQIFQAGPNGQKGHIRNAGHWGEDDGYEGCSRVRSGGAQFLERPNWSETSGRAMVVSSRAN